ncbi:MAG TPA: aminomethyltransferase family protein [Nitrospiria bacterium]|nr:aminomethyltransferase family protein [Nitrospiria bacterium]
MNRSALHSIHQGLGAVFDTFSDWDLPRRYGEVEEEYCAVRSSVGLCDCSHWGKVLLTGRDRGKFLHNLTSNEVASLKEGEGSYNTILTPKGRMLASFWVHALKDFLLIELDLTRSKRFIELLDKYTFFADVKMEDVTSEWGVLLLAGPSTPLLVHAVLGTIPPSLPPGHFFMEEVGGKNAIFINRPAVGGHEYAVYVRSESVGSVWERLMEAGAPFGIKPVGQDALEILRIEAGIPRYGSDMDDSIIPVEAGLEERAISYTKGCYVGQEVIARIKTYGHVNKHLLGLRIHGDEVPGRGSKVFDLEGKEAGWTTSAVHSPELGGVIALAYLRPQVSSPDTEVVVEVGGARLAARVSPLPFPRD